MMQTQIAIIGAGPIGLELAVNLQAAGVDYLQFDAQQVGHTISWYPRQARFFSSPDRIAIAGVSLQTPDQAKASREEYLAYLRAVVQQFDLQVHTYHRVTSIQPNGDGFVLTMHHRGQTLQCRARQVVCSIGDMHRPRRLDIPGEDLPHVSHYFDEPHAYFGQRLLVVGGRNSAVEAALRCHRAGAQVSLSYRRDTFDSRSVKYWLLPELQWLIDKGQIQFYPQTVPTAITPQQVRLASAGSADRSTQVAADFVLLLTGYEMDADLLASAGVTFRGDNREPTYDRQTMQTNVPGLYVAGTAAAGTQVRFKLFIENAHSHVVRIMRDIVGRDPVHLNPLGFDRLHEHVGEQADLHAES